MLCVYVTVKLRLYRKLLNVRLCWLTYLVIVSSDRVDGSILLFRCRVLLYLLRRLVLCWLDWLRLYV